MVPVDVEKLGLAHRVGSKVKAELGISENSYIQASKNGTGSVLGKDIFKDMSVVSKSGSGLLQKNLYLFHRTEEQGT